MLQQAGHRMAMNSLLNTVHIKIMW